MVIKLVSINRYLLNIGVVITDRLAMMIFQLWLSSYLVDRLGIDGFGLWSLVFNSLSIIGAVCILSLDAIVVKDVVNHKDMANKYINNAFFIQLVGFLVLVLIATFLYKDDSVLVCMSAASILVGNFFIILTRPITWIYSAEVDSKYRSVSVLFSFGLFLLIYLLGSKNISDYAVCVYGLFYFVQFLIMYTVYLFFYKKKLFHFRFNLLVSSFSKSYVRIGSALIISTLSVMIFTQSDVLMIAYFIDNQAVGQYSAGVKISTSIFMLAGILANTFYPKFLVLPERIRVVFLSFSLRLLLIATVIGSAIIYFLSNSIISIIYHHDDVIINVLKMHIWCSLFIFTGAFTSKYLYVKNFYKIEVIKTLVAAIINVALNILFIPFFGVLGAVYSSFVSFFMANFILFYFFSSTKIVFAVHLSSFFGLLDIKKMKREIGVLRCYFR